MAILVTGAAGFVALNVVEHLLAAGREVVGLDRIPLPARAERDFSRLPGRLTLIGGSILSDADLSRALTMRPIEAVIHCAVITAGARREVANPGAIVAVNVQGAVDTLVAAARRGVKRFVYPSSGAVYGASAAQVDVMDEDALRPAPVALYGLTKLAAESILARVAETQGVSFTAARLGVVYGPWEYATGVRDTLSPMLQTLELAEAGGEAVLGPPWRGDFTFSRDIAAGLVAIAEAPVLPRVVYNLATGRANTAEDWCRVVATRVPGFRWRRAAEGEVGNVESHTGFDRGAMDIGKITADTTYRPRFDLAGAADHLLAWRAAGGTELDQSWVKVVRRVPVQVDHADSVTGLLDYVEQILGIGTERSAYASLQGAVIDIERGGGIADEVSRGTLLRVLDQLRQVSELLKN